MMSGRSESAGEALRAAQNAALGDGLEWTELEALTLDRAVAAADRSEQLSVLLSAELAGDSAPSTVVKLSAELRMLERQVVDLVGRLNPSGVEVKKSERHSRAAGARWNRQHHGEVG
ncbi:MAG: hypothetical protein WBD41_27545 [Rhodococcus sp. (in: high G+C Gram-positive bacteria)]